MAAVLALDDFAPHTGSIFSVPLGDGGTYHLTLTAARPLTPHVHPAQLRAPFELRFSGPGPAGLSQATVPMQHAALGRVEIFIVPIGRDGDGLLYQAIFT